MLGPSCCSVACFLLVYFYLPDCIFSFLSVLSFSFIFVCIGALFYVQYLKIISYFVHIISSYPVVKILITVCHYISIFNFYVLEISLLCSTSEAFCGYDCYACSW